MGICLPCFEGPLDDKNSNADIDPETKRQQQAQAAEERLKKQNAKGVRDPEGLRKKQMKMQELEKKAAEQERQDGGRSGGGGLKWQVG